MFSEDQITLNWWKLKKPSSHEEHPSKPRIVRWAWLSLAGACIGAGAIGVVLPGIPTTPFLLVAAWAAPKGSPKLHHWLHSHATYGPMIHAWNTQRAIPRSAKISGVVLMMISLAMMWWMNVPRIFLFIAAIFFTFGACFLIWCKEPQYGLNKTEHELLDEDEQR